MRFIRKVTFSKVAIKVLTTWQFCSTTQVPFFVPSSIRPSAMIPWPWPRDRENSLLAPKPWSSANFNKIAMGSAPGVRTNISGMQECESAKEAARSKGGGTMYWCPNCSIEWSKNLGKQLTASIHEFPAALHNIYRISSIFYKKGK